MSSRWNRLGFVARVMMGATVALGGCVANDISLSINEFVAPDSSMASSNVCEFDSTSLALTRGVYDAALGSKLGSGYTVDFGVTNNLEVITTEDINTQEYYVSSFDVEVIPQGSVDGGAHAVIPPSARSYNYAVASQRIAPSDTAFFSVQAIGADLAAAFIDVGGGSVEVRVRPVATRAEEEQRGAYTSLPIDVCLGCLTGTVDYPACSTLAGVTPLVGNVCNYAQDVPVTCCLPKGATVPVCGNAVAIASKS